MTTLTKVLGGLVLGACVSASALAAPILDKYVGGIDHSYGDVIGSSMFDIISMDAQHKGTKLDVQVTTNFAGHAGVFAAYTDTAAAKKRGIGYGDLFLANDWAPTGSAGNGYKTDTSLIGTHWTYGFALDNRWNNTGGTGYLYELDSLPTNANHNVDDLFSQDFVKGATFRDNQIVAVNKASKNIKKLGRGTWHVNANKGLDFEFDVQGTSLLKDDTLAIRWEMTCANDVIEGSVRAPVHVPTPATVPLMLTGLLALVLVRRRRAAQR